jgi:hypothetical protein
MKNAVKSPILKSKLNMKGVEVVEYLKETHSLKLPATVKAKNADEQFWFTEGSMVGVQVDEVTMQVRFVINLVTSGKVEVIESVPYTFESVEALGKKLLPNVKDFHWFKFSISGLYGTPMNRQWFEQDLGISCIADAKKVLLDLKATHELDNFVMVWTKGNERYDSQTMYPINY